MPQVPSLVKSHVAGFNSQTLSNIQTREKMQVVVFATETRPYRLVPPETTTAQIEGGGVHAGGGGIGRSHAQHDAASCNTRATVWPACLGARAVQRLHDGHARGLHPGGIKADPGRDGRVLQQSFTYTTCLLHLGAGLWWRWCAGARVGAVDLEGTLLFAQLLVGGLLALGHKPGGAQRDHHGHDGDDEEPQPQIFCGFGRGRCRYRRALGWWHANIEGMGRQDVEVPIINSRYPSLGVGVAYRSGLETFLDG